MLTLLLATHRAFAGHNCKCQDPSGTGPQYDSITQYCCGNKVSTTCPPGQPIYHGDQHHQVSSLCPISLAIISSAERAERSSKERTLTKVYSALPPSIASIAACKSSVQ